MNEGELKVAKRIYEIEIQNLEQLYYRIGGSLSFAKLQLEEVQRRLDELEVKA